MLNVAVGVALVSVLAVTASLTGLALHRDAEPWMALLVAGVLVVAPPAALAAVSHKPATTFAIAGLAWPIAIYLLLPVYFPAERNEALLTAIRFGDGVVSADPHEPALPAAPPLAQAVVQAEPPPTVAAPPLRNDQIVLHYEGEGRRMTVDLTVEHGSKVRELQMLLDTGATFTTLSTQELASLGLTAGPDDPRITLQTANGEREARLLLLDRLWLGDLVMEGVAIATCDACASDRVSGLLGLNVTGGFNLAIDADRQEITFTRRADYSRHLDMQPFVEIGSTVRQTGERVRVQPWLINGSNRTVRRADIALRCGEQSWVIPLGAIASGQRGTGERRLPIHPSCDRYQITLHAADW